MRKEQTEVLVVGAGPVGLWTALSLAEGGVEVSIIDQEQRTAARSYACALHSRTLTLLRRLGLAEAVLERGRRISRIAFYEQASRCAEINLSELGGDFPFLLILPQNALEEVLEQRLRQAGVNVRWSHRFDGLAEEEEETVAATVEELAGTAVGYIVPHWETIVKHRWPIRSHFLVGADGHKSLVRQRLGIDLRRVAGPEYFVAYEFASDQPAADEVRVVLDKATANVLWPLPGNKSRWTFQLTHSDLLDEFPEKERRAVRPEQPGLEDRMREYVQRAAQHRAPWFTAGVEQIAWCSGVVFEHQLAAEFGRNRCWLAGDAAHQTGPVGVQSLNVGFSEGEALAGALRKILREDAPMAVLETYNRQHQDEWRRLLGLTGGLKAGAEASPWVREHSARILPCLPASDGDLVRLAKQLKLDFA